MSGVQETYGEREKRLRLERDQRLRQFISENRPVAAIAKLEGIEFSYAKILIRELVSKEGLAYKPERIACRGTAQIHGLTDASRRFRAKLGDYLHSLGGDHREVALKTGVMFRSQRYAKDRPFNYDWSLSSMERLADAADVPFRSMMLEALLTPEEVTKARKIGLL